MKPSSWCPAGSTCACAVALVALIACPFPQGSRPPTWRSPRACARRSSRASRSAEPAQLRARPVVLTRLDHLEPLDDLAARHRVLLHAELRDGEAVDHVLRPEVHPDDLVDRHVHLVEEHLIGPRVGDLPVELLRRHVDVEVARRYL